MVKNNKSKKKFNKNIFCFDIDNTICRTKKSEYAKSIPIKKNIKTINKLFENGHFIKLFTSRYMGRTNSDPNKAHKLGYLKTLNQLKKWDLKFHELIMGKPRYDIYIDDKNINFSKNWSDFIIKKYLK